jgi:hypothetical protein
VEKKTRQFLTALFYEMGNGKGKGKASLDRPRGFQEVEVPRFDI